MNVRHALALCLGPLALVACTANVVVVEPDPDASPSATPTAAPTVAPTATPSADAGGKQLELPKKVCTEMGCIDGLTIDIEPSQGLPKGRYELEVEADGKKSTCEIALPLPACDKGRAQKCTGDVEMLVGENGCALKPEEHGFGPLSLKGAPASVKVTVKKDKKVVGSGTFSPTYQTVQPNGPECPPTCKQAKDKVTLKLK